MAIKQSYDMINVASRIVVEDEERSNICLWSEEPLSATSLGIIERVCLDTMRIDRAATLRSARRHLEDAGFSVTWPEAPDGN